MTDIDFSNVRLAPLSSEELMWPLEVDYNEQSVLSSHFIIKQSHNFLSF